MTHLTSAPREGIVKPGWMIVGVAATARFVGIAVTVGGEPLLWRVFRVPPDDPRRASIVCVLEPAIRRFNPAAIVLLAEADGDGRHRRAARVIGEFVRPVLRALGLPVIEVGRQDLASSLCASGTTNAALRRKLLKDGVGAQLAAAKAGGVGDTVRYWESAVLASGAARVPFVFSQTVQA
jgi:hypothetical protein